MKRLRKVCKPTKVVEYNERDESNTTPHNTLIPTPQAQITTKRRKVEQLSDSNNADKENTTNDLKEVDEEKIELQQSFQSAKQIINELKRQVEDLEGLVDVNNVAKENATKELEKMAVELRQSQSIQSSQQTTDDKELAPDTTIGKFKDYTLQRLLQLTKQTKEEEISEPDEEKIELQKSLHLAKQTIDAMEKEKIILQQSLLSANQTNDANNLTIKQSLQSLEIVEQIINAKETTRATKTEFDEDNERYTHNSERTSNQTTLSFEQISTQTKMPPLEQELSSSIATILPSAGFNAAQYRDTGPVQFENTDLEPKGEELALDKEGFEKQLEMVRLELEDVKKRVEITEVILCIGNPGTGKSTLLNSTIDDVKFNSGFSIGSGKTNKMEEYRYDGRLYIDTPGLADPKYREESANAITQALRKNVKTKILFVMTLEAGHIRLQDQVTLSLVLEAIQDKIKEDQYGIIINKVPMCDTANVQNLIENKSITDKLFFKRKPNMPLSNRIVQIPMDMGKTEEDNVLLNLPEEYSAFLKNLRHVQFTPGNVKDIDWNSYERLKNEIQETEDECKKNKDKNILLEKELHKKDEVTVDRRFDVIFDTETNKSTDEKVFHLKVHDKVIVHNDVKVLHSGSPKILTASGLGSKSWSGENDEKYSTRPDSIGVQECFDQDLVPKDTIGRVTSVEENNVTIVFEDYHKKNPIQVQKPDCDGIYTYESEIKETCKSLAKRGISLGDLLEFYSQLVGTKLNPKEDTASNVAQAFINLGDTKLNPKEHTTSDVAKAFIIPQTTKYQKAYTDSITRSKLASRMVSHTWQNKFIHLVAAIVADAKGLARYEGVVAELSCDSLPQLQKDLKKTDKLDIVYWVCAFSINQHSMDMYPNGHPKCEVENFDGMFNELVNKNTHAHHVIAIDQDCTIFSRAWVIAEMIEAYIIREHLNNSNKLEQNFFAFEKEYLKKLIETKVDIRNCNAYKSEDKDMILAKAKQNCEIDLVNMYINDSIMKIVKKTEEAIKKEDTTRVLLIGNNGVGKTTLRKAMTGSDAVKLNKYEYEYNEEIFMELSGLANSRARTNAAKIITSALKEGGKHKIMFIITLEAGRIKTDDTDTIISVLKVAPIEDNFTVIINKASTKVIGLLKGKNDVETNELLQLRLPNESIGHIKCIPQSGFNDELFIKSVQDILNNALAFRINDDKVTSIKTETKEEELEFIQKRRKEDLEEEKSKNITLKARIQLSLQTKNSLPGTQIHRVDERGMSVNQLLDVVKIISERCNVEGWKDKNQKKLKSSTVTMYEASKYFIIPNTRENKCSWVESVAKGPQPVDWFVSHWWGESLTSFVSCVRQHATDHCYSFDHTYYWVCAYANNQDDLGSANLDDPEGSSFLVAMERANFKVLSIVDPEAVMYTRIWCGLEIFMGLNGKYEIYSAAKAGTCKAYDIDLYKDLLVDIDGGKTNDEVWTCVEDQLANSLQTRTAVGITVGLAENDGNDRLRFPKIKAFREKCFPIQSLKKFMGLKI